MPLLLLLLAARWRPRARAIRRVAIAVGLLAVADLSGCALWRDVRDAPPRTAHVAHVVDGDTLTIRAGGRRQTVRLLGIDAPELHRAPAACGAPDARANLRRLTEPGRDGVAVRLRVDPHSGAVRDRYGRLLAYVDGSRGDVGEAQLRAGLARVYRYRGRPFSRVSRYRHVEATARAHGRGIWATCDDAGARIHDTTQGDTLAHPCQRRPYRGP